MIWRTSVPFEIDHLRAFDLERRQFLGRKRDELAAGNIRSLCRIDFRLVDLLTGSRIMRPYYGIGDLKALICIRTVILSASLRLRILGKLVVSAKLPVSIARQPHRVALTPAGGHWQALLGVRVVAGER